jgi:hypothetical protein
MIDFPIANSAIWTSTSRIAPDNPGKPLGRPNNHCFCTKFTHFKSRFPFLSIISRVSVYVPTLSRYPFLSTEILSSATNINRNNILCNVFWWSRCKVGCDWQDALEQVQSGCVWFCRCQVSRVWFEQVQSELRLGVCVWGFKVSCAWGSQSELRLGFLHQDRCHRQKSQFGDSLTCI